MKIIINNYRYKEAGEYVYFVSYLEAISNLYVYLELLGYDIEKIHPELYIEDMRRELSI